MTEYIGQTIACPHCAGNIVLQASEENEPKWEYLIGKKAFGPCTIGQLRKLVASGVLTASTIVIRKGSDERIKIYQLLGFSDIRLTGDINEQQDSQSLNNTDKRTSQAHESIFTLLRKPLTRQKVEKEADATSTRECSFWWPDSRIASNIMLTLYSFAICKVSYFWIARFSADDLLFEVIVYGITIVALLFIHATFMAGRCLLFLEKNNRVMYGLLPTRGECETVASSFVSRIRKDKSILGNFSLFSAIGLTSFIIPLVFDNIANPSNVKTAFITYGIATTIVLFAGFFWQHSSYSILGSVKYGIAVLHRFRRLLSNSFIFFGLILALLLCTAGVGFHFLKENRLKNGELAYLNALHQYYGHGITNNIAESIRLTRVAADLGYPEAQWSLGFYFDKGEGVPENTIEAFKWYKMGAEQGNASAECGLAHCYNEGRGVNQDPKAALKWYQLAADQGEDIAQCGLALCYLNGKVIPKDPDKAEMLLKFAADNGSETATQILNSCGIAYPVGQGQPYGARQTMELYRKYAEQGDKLSQYAFAMELLYDDPNNGDAHKEGFAWMMKALNQGVIPAMTQIGGCYVKGIGVEPDAKKAREWWQKASDLGDPEAKLILDQITNLQSQHATKSRDPYFDSLLDKGYQYYLENNPFPILPKN